MKKNRFATAVAVLSFLGIAGIFASPVPSTAETYRPDLIAFTASPQNPSIGQETTVLARFKSDQRPRQGTVVLMLLDRAGRTLREWQERDLNPAFLTPIEGGASEWIYRVSFTAQREYAELRLTWKSSYGYEYDSPRRVSLTLSVGGSAADVGGSGGLVNWRITRDARRDGDEMRTAATFTRRPDPDSVRLIIERRGLFSGLYDDRTIYPEWEGYENGRNGYENGYGDRWRVRFEFTAEKGRHRMKLRWRVDGTEYEHIDNFRVDDGILGDSGGCDAGLGMLGCLVLVPALLGVRRARRGGAR